MGGRLGTRGGREGESYDVRERASERAGVDRKGGPEGGWREG